MSRYLIIGLLGALCLSLGAVVVLQRTNAALSDDNARLSRSIVALEEGAALSRLAAEVAKAEAARQQARAKEYDAFRASLMNGEQDADLPDWFTAWLDDLLGGL